MVLRPLDLPEMSATRAPAWEAVARTQKQPAHGWWLIAQPDHADLAGDLAERICWQHFPALDADVLEAIRLHDEGWREFDLTPSTRETRPLSFLDMGPADFLKAWRGSIARAEESSAVGGLLVSTHFRRLAEFRQQLASDSAGDNHLITKFLGEELAREARLMAAQSRDAAEIKVLVDALQFCDLLSLYLCCGSCEEVEFPQVFMGQSVLVHYDDGLYRTVPRIFSNGASLGVTARKYPSGESATALPILLG